MARSICASHAGRQHCLQSYQRPAGEPHGRLPRRQVDDAEVAQEDAVAEARPQRLGAGLLGGEALGIGGGAICATLGESAFGLGEDAMDEAIAMALDGALDPADVDKIGADAEDHAGPSG